jgi:hypothetical protein
MKANLLNDERRDAERIFSFVIFQTRAAVLEKSKMKKLCVSASLR